MTKKDYVVLAKALAHAMPTVSSQERLHQWKICVEAIATALGIDNPRFNYERFVEACQAMDKTRRDK